MEPTVTIYTQVYNTRPYLEQCIKSVLDQTYTNFEYIIVDNGSTDGCHELIETFAEQDSRIKVVVNQVNQLGILREIINQKGCGIYLSVLDSDDWWEPDYLSHLVGFLEANDVDLAVTGTVQYFEAGHTSQIMRKLERPAILSQREFAQFYPLFWTYPSTIWASIIKMNIFRKADMDSVISKMYPYGSDTMLMLQYIKQCSRIGIDNSALYHYRMHAKSISYQYNPRRFDANVAYYEQIKAFLELHHTFDPLKQEWLKRVHLKSMVDTLQLLRGAKVPEDEKVRECARIVTHPITAAALTNDCNEREQWYALMRGIVFHAVSSGILLDAENLHTVLKLLSPRCCGIALTEGLKLLAREAPLCAALQKDNWEQLIQQLMDLIHQKRYATQYDLGQILCGLIPDGSPLRGIADTRFFDEYAESCMMIFEKDYANALDQMTGLLLQGKKLYDGERFLDVYLTLAALENQAPAFVFGKLQLAELYLSQGRREECRAAVDELAEMGVDNEELIALRQGLEASQ